MKALYLNAEEGKVIVHKTKLQVLVGELGHWETKPNKTSLTNKVCSHDILLVRCFCQ